MRYKLTLYTHFVHKVLAQDIYYIIASCGIHLCMFIWNENILSVIDTNQAEVQFLCWKQLNTKFEAVHLICSKKGNFSN